MKPHPVRSFWYIIFACFCLFVWQTLWAQSQPATETIPYSQFQTYLKGGRIAQVKISADQIEGTFKQPPANDTKHFVINRVESGLAAELLSQNVTFSDERENPLWASFVSWIVPVMFLFALWVFVLGRVSQKSRIGSGGFMMIGKSKAKIYMEEDILVTIANVAGVDEAKEELQEVIEFLKTPERFRRLGGKIPKGILFIGPPGADISTKPSTFKFSLV